MFSTTTSNKDICSSLPMLTPFSAQIVGDKLVREAKRAVDPASGLHGSRQRHLSDSKLQWADVGAATVVEF